MIGFVAWLPMAALRFVAGCVVGWLELRYGGDDPEPAQYVDARPRQEPPAQGPCAVPEPPNPPADAVAGTTPLRPQDGTGTPTTRQEPQ